MIININILVSGERKEYAGKSGMSASGRLRDFLILYENKNAELTLIFNRGVGLYNEDNAFFPHGAAFTEGNSIADDPAERGGAFGVKLILNRGLPESLNWVVPIFMFTVRYQDYFRDAILQISILKEEIFMPILSVYMQECSLQGWAGRKLLLSQRLMEAQYFINQHFMLLGITSLAIPGHGIRDSLPEDVNNWISV